jgi:ribosomal-protein-alanine N-acetyltransferase
MTPTALTMLREAKRADVPWLVEAELACFPEEAWTHGMVADEFERPGGVQWIAEVQDGESRAPIGFAFGWLVLGELHVLHIATMPERRRGGSGRALLQALLATPGTELCWLEVRADNGPAIALYSREGFEHIAVRKRYYSDGADAVVMRKVIAIPG